VYDTEPEPPVPSGTVRPTRPCVRCDAPAENPAAVTFSVGRRVVTGAVCVACFELNMTDHAAFFKTLVERYGP
jgi:hypothetical protein